MHRLLIILIPFLIISLVLFAGAIVLQIYLSKKENRRLGQILPGVYLAISVAFTLLFFLISISTSIWATLGSSLLIFIICNIPTAILLIIYYVLRGSRKNKKEIDKMNIQDLS